MYIFFFFFGGISTLDELQFDTEETETFKVNIS